MAHRHVAQWTDLRPQQIRNVAWDLDSIVWDLTHLPKNEITPQLQGLISIMEVTIKRMNKELAPLVEGKILAGKTPAAPFAVQ